MTDNPSGAPDANAGAEPRTPGSVPSGSEPTGPGDPFGGSSAGGPPPQPGAAPQPGYRPPPGYPPPPGYGQAPPPGYGQAPPPGYEQAPPPGYGQAPRAGYGQPPPGYGPPPGYSPQPDSAPPAGYAPTNYGSPAGYAPTSDYTQAPQYPAPAGLSPPSRSGPSRGLLVTAAAVVVALIAGIVIFAVSRGSGSGPKADDVAVGYLQALAAGDADKALSYGSATPDRTFLTSDILKKQQAIAKITAVNVVGSESRGSEARVNMSYNFGSQAVTDYYALTKIKGKWKLQSTTASANVSSGRSIPGLTLFGTKVASDTVTTFPGPLQWGSSDPNYEVKPLGSADRFATSPGDSNFTSLQYQLSQAGTKTLSDAFTAKIAECLKIKTASAPGCPQRSFAFSAVPNSFVWKLAGTGTDGITYRSSYSDPKKIDLSGLLRFTVTYQSRNFDNKIESKTDDVTSFVSGSATLEGDTATITLN